ncbi:toprim domain-containing protein [Helicobacter sp. 11S03491-1]|uniref:toprim domain-containing protein n=1 Tax=Helicobacter sp. 11S03491-1 TaxID=1476196 RepID=UPI000BA528BA|nr:toprim domain-containing protein [Helicobacter sp. 11S03491-1]
MQDLTLLPLHEILLHNGFKINRDKSSIRNPVVENENEKLVITKKGDNYLYFNVDGSNDRGNIINFCKNRNINIKTLIDNYYNGNINDIEIPKYFINEEKEEKRAVQEKYDALSNYNSQKNQFFLNKGIYDSTIEPYKDSFKQDSYGNICFPHYKLIEEQINQKTISYIKICGYTQRLSFPLYNDQKGNPREKPLKHFHHGNKCLEILNINKNPKEIKKIIFGESIVDILSLMQIYKDNYNPNETMLISTGGNFHQDGIKPTLNNLFEVCKEARITTCFDNDQNGLKYTDFIQKFVLEKTKKGTSTYKPFAKDVNDDLNLRQITQLKTLNTHIFEEYLESQLLNYKRSSDTNHRKNILEKIRKINNIKPLKEEYKERFNQIHKHKAIKKL